MIKKDFWNFLNEMSIREKQGKEIMKESESIVKYVQKSLGDEDYWQVSYDEIRVIYTIVKVMNPTTIIETGMGSGVSTTAMLAASNDETNVISIDPGVPYGKGDKEVGFLIPINLRKKHKFVKGTSKQKMKEVLSYVDKVDIFFHDSDHTYENIMLELNEVWPKLSEESIILVDNYDWTDAPIDFSKKMNLDILNIADDLAILF